MRSGLSTPHSTGSEHLSTPSTRSRNGSPLRPGFTSPVGSHYALKPGQPDYQGVEDSFHPVISAGRVAVITGGASGIGKAAAIELAKCVIYLGAFLLLIVCSTPYRLGLKIAIADIDETALENAGKEIQTIVGDANILVVPTDVSDIEQVKKLRDRVYEQWGEVGRTLSLTGRELGIPLGVWPRL